MDINNTLTHPSKNNVRDFEAILETVFYMQVKWNVCIIC